MSCCFDVAFAPSLVRVADGGGLGWGALAEALASVLAPAALVPPPQPSPAQRGRE